MSQFDSQQLKTFVHNYVAERLLSQERNVAEELGDDCDLIVSGILDSLGMLELMTALQEYCGRDISFEELDPESMTVVGPLCDFVANQLTEL